MPQPKPDSIRELFLDPEAEAICVPLMAFVLIAATAVNKSVGDCTEATVLCAFDVAKKWFAATREKYGKQPEGAQDESK